VGDKSTPADPFGILTRLFGRLGRVLRLVLNTQLQLARAEHALEAERAAKAAKLIGAGVALLASAGLLLQVVAVVALWLRTPIPPDGAVGIVLAFDLLVGLVLLNRGQAVMNEREWMIDTRTRTAETLEILRG
jgi:hypothetical protein